MKRVYRTLKPNHFELIGEFPEPENFHDLRNTDGILTFKTFPRMSRSDDNTSREPSLEEVKFLYDRVNGYEVVATSKHDIEQVILEYGGVLYHNPCDVFILNR
jgi:hypothetical protein